MAVHSQCKADLILVCKRVLHFFGGVPKAIIPDNSKSTVTKASKYESQLNETFARYYNWYNNHQKHGSQGRTSPKQFLQLFNQITLTKKTKEKTQIVSNY